MTVQSQALLLDLPDSKPEVEPPDDAPKAFLLDPSLVRLARISSQSKSMLYAREELDVVGLAVLIHHVNGSVARLRWEGMIDLGAREKQRSLQPPEVMLLQERWMRKGACNTGWLCAVVRC